MYETVAFYLNKEMDTDEIVENLKESRPEVFEKIDEESIASFCKTFAKLRRCDNIPKSVRLDEIKECKFIDTIIFYGEENHSIQDTADKMIPLLDTASVSLKQMVKFIEVIFAMEGFKNLLRKRRIFTIDFFDYLQENNIKLSDIARTCDMTYSNFAYYKNGERGINDNMIQKITKKYGSHPEFFDIR